MKRESKIKFIRKYMIEGKHQFIDVVYESGYTRTTTMWKAGTKIDRFIIEAVNAARMKTHIDILHGKEIIYY